MVKTTTSIVPAETLLLRVRNVTVNHGWRRVVDSANLEVKSGEVWALCGPPNSGKSTLMSTIAGAVRADAGRVERHLSKMKDGSPAFEWLGHASFLYDELTVAENLKFWAKLHRLPQRRQRIDSWLMRFDLSDWCDERIDRLDISRLRCVSLVRCMMAEPMLVALDEPFVAIDGLSARRLVDAIDERRSSGRATVISVASMIHARTCATHVATMANGRITWAGAIGDWVDDGEPWSIGGGFASN